MSGSALDAPESPAWGASASPPFSYRLYNYIGFALQLYRTYISRDDGVQSTSLTIAIIIYLQCSLCCNYIYACIYPVRVFLTLSHNCLSIAASSLPTSLSLLVYIPIVYRTGVDYVYIHCQDLTIMRIVCVYCMCCMDPGIEFSIHP